MFKTLLHLERHEPELALQRLAAIELLASEQRLTLMHSPQVLRGGALLNSHAFFSWNIDIAGNHLALHVDCTAYGADNTRELYQQAVSRRLDDATAVFPDLRITNPAPT